MVSGNTVELVLSAKDEKLSRVLSQGEKQIRTFGDKTISTFKRVGASMQGFSNTMINSLAMVGIGFGAVEMTKDMLEFEGALRRIRRTSDLSAKDLQELRQTILDLIDPSAKVKLPITKGEFAEMAVEMNATGVPLKTIRDLLPQVGKGAIAARVGHKLYAETIGELLDKYKVLIQDMPALQEQLNTAMKFDDVKKNPEAFLQTLNGLAKQMQIIEAVGTGNVTALLATLGAITPIMGSPEAAGASMDALFNGLLRLSKNPAMKKALAGEGINFFEKSGKIKPLEELLPEIKKLDDLAKKHGKDIDAVAMQVLGRPEAGKAIMVIAKNLEDAEEKVRRLKSTAGGLDKDFSIEAEGMVSKLKTFQNQLDRFKVDHMTTALKYLSSIMDQLNNHPMIAKGLLGGAAATAGVLVGGAVIRSMKSVLDFARDIGGIWTGKGMGGLPGGVTGPLGRGLGGPVPVYVVNKRLSLVDPSGGWKPPTTTGPTNIPAGPASGKSGKIASVLGKVGAVTGAGLAGYEIGGLINQGLGWISEKLTGGAYKGEGFLGEAIYDLIHMMENRGDGESKPEINIYYDPWTGQAMAESESMKPEINLRRGRF